MIVFYNRIGFTLIDDKLHWNPNGGQWEPVDWEEVEQDDPNTYLIFRNLETNLQEKY